MSSPGTGPRTGIVSSALRVVLAIERAFFLAVLVGLLALGLIPIVCRFTGLPPVPWTSALSQHLILWLALFGAGAATRDRKHICIDAVSHYFGPRTRLAFRAGGYLFAAAVCVVLVPVAVAFLRDELEFGSRAEAFPGVETRWLPAVLPVGLAILALRLLIAAAADGWSAFARGGQEPEP